MVPAECRDTNREGGTVSVEFRYSSGMVVIRELGGSILECRVLSGEDSYSEELTE